MSGHEQRTTAGLQAYAVHCAGEAPPHTHAIEARTFADAAVAFLERWHVAAIADEVQVIVEESATGERHCFTLDLDSGQTTPCD